MSVAFPELSRHAAFVQLLVNIITLKIVLEDCDRSYLSCSRDYSAAYSKLKVKFRGGGLVLFCRPTFSMEKWSSFHTTSYLSFSVSYI